jgi:hypothetical protein
MNPGGRPDEEAVDLNVTASASAADYRGECGRIPVSFSIRIGDPPAASGGDFNVPGGV